MATKKLYAIHEVESYTDQHGNERVISDIVKVHVYATSKANALYNTRYKRTYRAQREVKWLVNGGTKIWRVTAERVNENG